MYLDISLKKITTIVALALVMFVSLVATFSLKEARYGSTPPFASIGLGWQEITSRFEYGLLGVVWNAGEAVRAPFAFVFGGGEQGREARAIPVLTYHRIVSSPNDLNNVTVQNFRDQMLALKSAGWETITLEEYRRFMHGEIELPERSFLITFDDGAKESFYPVDPLFWALGYEGAMYVIAQAAETPESTYYLSSAEIKRMLESGRWEIGSHSFDGHRPYPADEQGSPGIFFADKLWLEDEGRLETDGEFTARVHDDLAKARSRLEATYGGTVDTFAFPLGNETGIEGAANFPDGASITARVAAAIYSLGFLQTTPELYSFNYPESRSFIARRIHVDFDWNGERLLSELEDGLPKDLPLEDDFSRNRGWLSAWGELNLGKNNLSLKADQGASSASTFLDGTLLWDNYSFDAAIAWQSGFVSLLADVRSAKTYDSCAFGEGEVRIQYTEDGVTHVSAQKKDPRIAYGDDVRIGIRVHDDVIECTWNYESILEAYDRPKKGGVGVQIWNPVFGSAVLQVSGILVRPFPST